jgi:hypothetical protein
MPNAVPVLEELVFVAYLRRHGFDTHSIHVGAASLPAYVISCVPRLHSVIT